MRRGEQGSLAVYTAVVMLLLAVVVGLVVDGAGLVAASQQADLVAREAARAGGNALDGTVVTGGPVRFDGPRARAAAEQVLRANGVTGTVTTDGDRVTVRTRVTYRPVVLAFGQPVVTGEATAVAGRVQKGVRR
ncbi:MAG: hypothetical protein Q4G45_13860 [Actinomycetia bacterium]|nr:hypothetical protein [Actinomycetes bacterium]